MIVPMKKVTLLCLTHARDATLEQLRDLGVVHLQPVSQRESESVEAARREFEYVRNALEVLPHHPDKTPSGRTSRMVVEELWKLIHEQRAIEDEQIALAHEEQRIAPFGNFNPDTVHALRERGVFVHLYQASPKLPAVMPDDAVYVELARDKTSVHFAVFARGPVEVQNAQEVSLPAKSLAEVRQRHEALTDRQRAIEEEIARYGGDHAQVAALLADAEDKWKFAEAQAGMGAGAGEAIAYLQGFCPAEEIAKLQKAAPSHGWGLVVEEPGDADTVPTLLRHPRWVKPVQPVLDMIGILPGYREVDISGAFLLFLALFFAILIGDAGYGVLFLAGSVWARRKWPQASARLFTLINIMSGATILWGVLTGVYFGYSPASLRFLEWPWLKNDENVKWLAFTIGVVHLTLAHVWNIARAPRSLQSVAQFGWICTTWTMYFFALKMVLGQAMPGFVLPMFAVGVVCIVLFMTPRRQLKAEWFNHAMLPLNLVSNFVDVVSYIRLFAVGTASLAVASSFNSMLAPMFAQWWTAIFGIVFLFLAHALNIALCLMGVMVHGIRLNTLEFSGHIGLQWTGTAFAPFRSVKQQSQSE